MKVSIIKFFGDADGWRKCGFDKGGSLQLERRAFEVASEKQPSIVIIR